MLRRFLQRFFSKPASPPADDNFHPIPLSVPEFLAELKPLLEPLARPCVRVAARDLGKPFVQDPLALTASKFGGIPFWSAEKPLPPELTDGPMVLLAQINFADVPPLPDLPEDGLIQFYVTGNFDDFDAVAFYWPADRLQGDHISVPSLQVAPKEEYFFNTVHALTFSPDVDKGCSEDEEFEQSFTNVLEERFPGKDLTDDQSDAVYDLYTGGGHKLGGYAAFTQHDPRGHASRPTYNFLQMDSLDGIMIGDAGIVHIFLDPKTIRPGCLENAWYYWDCC